MLYKFYLFALSIILFMLSCSKDRIPNPNKSSENNILSFSFTGLNPSVKGKIDTTNRTINVIVPSGTDLKSLKPTIEISSGASIDPASGIVQDFSKPVVYTITSENGKQKTITVHVTQKVDFCLVAQVDESTSIAYGRKSHTTYYYTFDKQGILQKLKIIYTIDQIAYADSVFFGYDKSGKLIKITNSRDITVDVTYKANTFSLKRSVPFYLGSIIPYWSEQITNERGQIVSTSDYSNFRFEYNNKGQLVKKIKILSGKELVRQEFGYDEMKNPYQKLYIKPSIISASEPVIFVDFSAEELVQANNIVKIISSGDNGKIEQQFSIKYAYNKEGYPVSYTSTGSKGDVVKGVISYSNCPNTDE